MNVYMYNHFVLHEIKQRYISYVILDLEVFFVIFCSPLLCHYALFISKKPCLCWLYIYSVNSTKCLFL